MTTKLTEPMEQLAGQSTELFRTWVSFWPVAPLFGVEWRFAEIAGKTNEMAIANVTAAFDAVQPVTAPETEAPQATASVATEAAETQAEPAPEPVSEPQAHAIVETASEAMPEDLPSAIVPETITEVAPAAEAQTKTPPAATAAIAPEARIAEDALQSVERTLADLAAEADAGADAVPPTTLYETMPDTADDLKQIKGIGPGLESQLNALGIYKIAQLAEMTDANLVWIDENLTAFKGRCFRDDWVGQARGLNG